MKHIGLIILYLASLFCCVYSQEAKYKIKDIKIEGNKVYKDKKLFRIIVSRPSSFFKTRYYYPVVFKDDLKSIEYFYHINGYLDAKITGSELKMDSVKQSILITIKLSEGEVTTIDSINIVGNVSLPVEILKGKLKIKKGDALERKKIEKSNLALLSIYADNGYLDAEVRPDIELKREKNIATISFYISENRRFSINQIKINGLQKTQENIVRRELNFHNNEIINYTRLLQSQKKLYLTGLFKTVFIRPIEFSSIETSKKDILIDINENYSGEFNISAGFGSLDKLRGKVELYNNNIYGTARKIGCTGKISFIRRSFEASFSEPWTFGFHWNTDISFMMGYFEEPGYDLSQIGGKISIGRSFLDNSKITLSYRYEEDDLRNIKVTNGTLKNISDIRSLRLSYTYDSRDNLFNTNKGFYLDGSYELAGSFLSGSNTFSRTILQSKYFFPLNSITVLASSYELGWMYSSDGFSSIPLQERFYAGGHNSLRGFEYQTVGPVNEKRIPSGGRLKIVFNLLEIRRTLYKMIGTVLFFDIGNVWKNPEYFKIKEFRSNIGLGIRVNTPIGLARFDYGINLAPRTGEPKGMPYFSMGQAF